MRAVLTLLAMVFTPTLSVLAASACARRRNQGRAS
jgi:hypothetical protein